MPGMSFIHYLCDMKVREVITYKNFFDGNKFVILLSGFQKKTQKTPKGEIERAIRLMSEYYEEKKGEQR